MTPADATSPRFRRGSAALAAILAVLAALSACGDDRAPARRPSGPASGESATFTQILLRYDVTRSKAEAKELSVKLIGRILGGERMEDLLLRYTDDRDEGGKPYNDGSYTIPRGSAALPVVERTVFALKAGELAPDPVDTGLAYLVVRRDY